MLLLHFTITRRALLWQWYKVRYELPNAFQIGPYINVIKLKLCVLWFVAHASRCDKFNATEQAITIWEFTAPHFLSSINKETVQDLRKLIVFKSTLINVNFLVPCLRTWIFLFIMNWAKCEWEVSVPAPCSGGTGPPWRGTWPPSAPRRRRSGPPWWSPCRRRRRRRGRPSLRTCPRWSCAPSAPRRTDHNTNIIIQLCLLVFLSLTGNRPLTHSCVLINKVKCNHFKSFC